MAYFTLSNVGITSLCLTGLEQKLFARHTVAVQSRNRGGDCWVEEHKLVVVVENPLPKQMPASKKTDGLCGTPKSIQPVTKIVRHCSKRPSPFSKSLFAADHACKTKVRPWCRLMACG
jgi:hypothetical protein